MISRTWRLAALVGLLVGCSGGDDGTGPPPANRAPTIAFTFTKLGVVRNLPVDLTVAVDDLDDDPLTITWSITRGSLVAQNAAKTVMRWTAPSAVGPDTVVISVSDGTVTRSVTEVVKVGWPATGQTALSTYLKSRSPYIVSAPAISPNIMVEQGQVSNIEPGTELLIDTPLTVFDVIGTLNANGSPGERVVIRPNDRTFKCGDERGWWEGIRGATLSDGINTYHGQVNLTYAEIREANNAVRLRDGAGAVILDTRILCSGTSGVFIEGNGSLIIERSEVSNGRDNGISVSAISSLPDTVSIRECVISINGNAGIKLDLNDVDKEVPIDIIQNRITINFSRGITMAHSVFPRIHRNHFSGNGVEAGVMNIYLEEGYPGAAAGAAQLDATCNFWGAVVNQQSTIDATIRDILDSGGVGTRMVTSPWLNVDPLTSNPVCP